MIDIKTILKMVSLICNKLEMSDQIETIKVQVKAFLPYIILLKFTKIRVPFTWKVVHDKKMIFDLDCQEVLDYY